MQITPFLSAFCLGCIALGALYLLCPKNAFEKSVRFTFCLCFLCTVIASFSYIGKLSVDFLKTGESEIVSVGAAAESARLVFEKSLQNSNISFRKITVLADKNENGSIFISKVSVYSAEASEKIVGIIAGDGSYEVEVINE